MIFRFCYKKLLKNLGFSKPFSILVFLYVCFVLLLLSCVSQVSDGVEYAQKVVDMPEMHALKARAYLMLGVGYSLMSDEVQLQHDRQSYQNKAVDAFRK